MTDLENDSTTKPISPTETLAFNPTTVYLHLADATRKLKPYTPLIESTFNGAVAKICAALPVSDVDVVIYNSPHVIKEVGMLGRCYSPNFVLINVDPELPNLEDVIRGELASTLAHELHHCARWSEVGYGLTLIEAMISEGLADHFDLDVTGKTPRPWDTALSPRQISKYLKRAQRDFNNREYDHSAWFFGRGGTDIPRWTGYSLGFHLVGEYLRKHPDKKPSQLYNQETQEFI